VALSVTRRVRVIVTGGNGGIGKGIVEALEAEGHRVTIACRTIPKAEQALREIAGDVDVKYLDLADLSSIAAFSDSIESVDVLIDNAALFGIPLTPPYSSKLTWRQRSSSRVSHTRTRCAIGSIR
jgi:NAD(P)-dependent dehydrogenase (short-subunit alcohol dehydrogenase family)